MLIYYFINCALLPSWEQKIAFFARGLKLCETLRPLHNLKYRKGLQTYFKYINNIDFILI